MRLRYHDSPKWIVRHSLSFALLLLFIIQSIIVLFTGYPGWRMENQNSAIWPGFVMYYTYEMTVSIVADTYGALLLVLFAKWFYEEGSPESE